jgi:hypothetical protein
MKFAIGFAGLGYIVVWPITSPDFDGHRFGIAIFCRDGLAGLLDPLCDSSHALTLPPSLHVFGFAAALIVIGRVLVYALKRSRQVNGDPAIDPSLEARTNAPAPLWRKPPRRARAVKPRAQFGLRGTPR